jgi:hypothetical protein
VLVAGALVGAGCRSAPLRATPLSESAVRLELPLIRQDTLYDCGLVEALGMEVFLFQGSLDRSPTGLYGQVDAMRPPLVMLCPDGDTHHYGLVLGDERAALRMAQQESSALSTLRAGAAPTDSQSVDLDRHRSRDRARDHPDLSRRAASEVLRQPKRRPGTRPRRRRGRSPRAVQCCAARIRRRSRARSPSSRSPSPSRS